MGQPGIYTENRLEFNLKCWIFALAMMGFYWASGGRNIYVLPVIFIVSYIAMAWYDYLYRCEKKLKSGSGGINAIFDSIFKPKYTDDPEQGGEDKVEDQHAINKRYTFLFHMVFVAPLLLWVSYKGNKSDPRIYPVLGVAGGMALAYHGFRFVIYPRQP
jgi:hypothetical protein